MNLEEDLLYRLWLNILCKHEPELIHKCLNQLGTAEEIFHANPYHPKVLGLLKLSRVLMGDWSLEDARQLLEECRRREIRVISIADPAYPERLRQSVMPPQILYCRGELPDFDRMVCLGIVGARDCSDQGVVFAKKLARRLGSCGVMIVSGMALGVDGAAHEGALQAGMPTVAVLAGGADVIYPKAHKPLYQHILENGAVISERPPGENGRAHYYRQRNRILVGLCQGLVVIEGAEKSGTAITAGWAKEMDRDLFAVPGRPDDEKATLPNALIRDGAKLVTNGEDVLAEYIGVYPVELDYGLSLQKQGLPQGEEPAGRKHTGVRRTADKETNETESRAEHEKRTWEQSVHPVQLELPRGFEQTAGRDRVILEYLYQQGGTAHIDRIARDCRLDMAALNSALLLLQMRRLVRQSAGGYYSLETE